MSSRKKGKIIKSGDKRTILNVYKHFENQFPERGASFLVKKTSSATKVSERSIYRIRKEEQTGKLVTPKKVARKIEYKTSRKRKYDGFVVSAIRRIVHSFFKENLPPTLNAVLEKINEDETLPNLKRTTLWRILKENGFCYEKRNRKALLIERNDIIVWRHSYLRKIKQYRQENRKIVFLDETWVNVGQTTNKIWRDVRIKTPKDAFLAGLTTGLKNPTERGPRFVMTHAGGKDGFVAGAKMVFLAKKGADDYHDEMNGNRFERWFGEQLLPNVEPGTIIVMDNAKYHSRRLEKIPTTKSNKAEFKKWLTEKNISFPEDALNKELLAEVQKVKHLYERYTVDETAEKVGVSVLRLPPYHCELNPIELVWSQVKRHVAKNNKSFKKDLMEPLIDNAFSAVKQTQWANYVKHVEKIEEEMWKADNLQDDIEPFIIQLTNSSSSAEASSASDSQDTASQSSVVSGVDLLTQ